MFSLVAPPHAAMLYMTDEIKRVRDMLEVLSFHLPVSLSGLLHN